MVTLKEIAQHCGVSVTTVSNIVNGKPKKVGEETRKKVLDAIDELGYHPNYFAQGLRRQKTQTIGVIAEDLDQFTTPAVIEGIMEYCEQRKYRVLLQNLRLYARWSDQWFDKDELIRTVLDPALKELSSIKVDGLIYVAGHSRQIDFLSEAAESTPLVLAYCCSRKEIPSVEIDDEDGGYQMTKYILSQGHTKIGVVSGRADNMHAMRRLIGYQKALYEAGILYNPSLIRYANWEAEDAYGVTESLVKEGVTAILCMSDWMAGGVYNGVTDLGLQVGKDIAVTGFDNERLANWFVPRMTTCRLPLKEIGNQAARMLLNQLEQQETDGEETGQEEGCKSAEQHVKLPCELKIRKSVQKLIQEEQ